MRQINLGFEFFFTVRGAGRFRGRGSRFRVSPQMFADQLRLVLFERAGMRLLLGNAHQRQDVKNGFALDFQFPRQIIDSNLAHPLSRFCKLRAHI